MDQLYVQLRKAGLMFQGQTEMGAVDFILLETDDNGTTNSVDIISFETLFGDVKGNPSYEALSGLHTFKLANKEYSMTAKDMGYQKYFDKWKEEGCFKF
ncbi:hypothetical protein [Bacillus sp. AK031]